MCGRCGGDRLRLQAGWLSDEYESCTMAADCCNKSDECINGRCAMPAPQ